MAGIIEESSISMAELEKYYTDKISGDVAFMRIWGKPKQSNFILIAESAIAPLPRKRRRKKQERPSIRRRGPYKIVASSGDYFIGFSAKCCLNCETPLIGNAIVKHSSLCRSCYRNNRNKTYNPQITVELPLFLGGHYKKRITLTPGDSARQYYLDRRIQKLFGHPHTLFSSKGNKTVDGIFKNGLWYPKKCKECQNVLKIDMKHGCIWCDACGLVDKEIFHIADKIQDGVPLEHCITIEKTNSRDIHEMAYQSRKYRLEEPIAEDDIELEIIKFGW